MPDKTVREEQIEKSLGKHGVEEIVLKDTDTGIRISGKYNGTRKQLNRRIQPEFEVVGSIEGSHEVMIQPE